MPNSLNNIIPTVLPPNTRFKNLTNDLKVGKITMAEFNKECAYWLIKCDDLELLSLPTRINKMLAYDRMTYSEKNSVPNNFWRQKDVYGYLEQKQHIKNRNSGMLIKLIEFKSYIPEEDIKTRAKYDMIINQYGFEETNTIADKFGGEVVERGYKEEPF